MELGELAAGGAGLKATGNLALVVQVLIYINISAALFPDNSAARKGRFV